MKGFYERSIATIAQKLVCRVDVVVGSVPQNNHAFEGQMLARVLTAKCPKTEAPGRERGREWCSTKVGREAVTRRQGALVPRSFCISGLPLLEYIAPLCD